MAKKVDVLAKKQAELNTYVGQANAAISLVTSTVASLGAINENIDAGLAATKSGLTDAKTKNERIIKNFNALLDVE